MSHEAVSWVRRGGPNGGPIPFGTKGQFGKKFGPRTLRDVMLVLAEHANSKTCLAWPSLGTIEAQSGVHRWTIPKVLLALGSEFGYIVLVEEYIPRVKGNTYLLPLVRAGTYKSPGTDSYVPARTSAQNLYVPAPGNLYVPAPGNLYVPARTEPNQEQELEPPTHLPVLTQEGGPASGGDGGGGNVLPPNAEAALGAYARGEADKFGAGNPDAYVTKIRQSRTPVALEWIAERPERERASKRAWREAFESGKPGPLDKLAATTTVLDAGSYYDRREKNRYLCPRGPSCPACEGTGFVQPGDRESDKCPHWVAAERSAS